MNKVAEAFEKWWTETGSGMPPLPNEDAEEHAKRVSEMAYCAAVIYMGEEAKQIINRTFPPSRAS